MKLASELHKRINGRAVYVLDEPTTGLHLEDTRRLMAVPQGLVEKGDVVVVIEHNLDVIKCVDWVVDLSPEGGGGGGLLVAAGIPEQMTQVPQSFIGRYLAEVLEPSKPRNPGKIK